MAEAAKNQKPYGGAYPLDITEELERVKSSKEFKEFSDRLFERLDSIENAVFVQGKQIEQQTEQLKKMNEAFDMIMHDYFSDIKTDVKELSEYAAAQEGKSEQELIAEATPEMLKLKLELLREQIDDGIEEQMLDLSSPEVKEMHDKIVPAVRKEVEAMEQRLQEFIRQDLLDATGAIVKQTASMASTLQEDLRYIVKLIRENADSLGKKIKESEASIKRSQPTIGRVSHR